MTDHAGQQAAEPVVESADSIAKDIAEAIAEHRLPRGTKLREEALAGVYGVSRTKVRAALLMLSKDRLIDMVPEKGAFVAKPSATEAREIFAVRWISMAPGAAGCWATSTCSWPRWSATAC